MSGSFGITQLSQLISQCQRSIADIVTALSSIAIGLTGNNIFTGNNTFTGSTAFTGATSFKPPPTIGAGAVGTGTILPAGNVSVQLSRAGIGNGADKTNDTLFSYALPAKSLDVVGRGLRFLAWGDFAANGNDKVITFTVNGTIEYNTSMITDNGTWWRLQADLYKDGSNTQNGTGLVFHGAGVLSPVTILATATDTNVITFTVTGASPTTGAANDVLGHGMTVEFLN